jgi:titin
VSGQYDLGNSGDGLLVQGASGVQVLGNRICNNRSYGINVNGSSGCVVQGNSIGTDPSATRPLGNLQAGINLFGADTNRIGGFAPGAANIIQYNEGPGVSVFSGAANEISGNRIHDNGGLGIDLNADGVTTNDLADADSGPNQLQNYPLLTSAFSTNSMTHIEGSLNSTPNASFRLEFYASPAWDPQGLAEGQLFLGSTNLISDSNGDVVFGVNLSVPTPPGYVLTATATDGAGNTSEFCPGLAPAFVQSQSAQLSVTLTVAPNGNSSATVAWPGSATGFSLEHTPSLTPPIQWYPVSGGIYDNGSVKSYVITNGVATNDFFRLRLPQM